MATADKLQIDTQATGEEMADVIFGDGVEVIDATYTGPNKASGIFTDGDAVAPGLTPSDEGVILSTGRAKAVTNNNGDPNQNTNTSSQNNNAVDNDPDFNAAVGANTYDAVFLEADFIPDGDTMSMQFVFASEEYPEYTNSIYNDAVVVWINGVEVPLTIENASTSVSTVSDVNNINLYNDNTGDAFNTEMDGFTVTMTLTIPVNDGVLNSIRIGIADVSDDRFDSNVLIAADSLQTAVIANADEVDIAPGGSKVVDVLANDTNSATGTLTVTHINGIEVSAGDSVTLTTGQVVTLNADGTFTITADSDEESINFTYGIENDDGTSDVGYVTVNQVPCFVAGTLILTDRGERPVESLQPGDLVKTVDDGFQPLRWIGQRAVQAEGKLAPILFKAGALGPHRDIMLSPQHRVLMQDPMSELMFGNGEVLVAAKELVNGSSVQVVEGGTVTYVHMLFDRHQIVWSDGMKTESFLPGPQTTQAFEQDIIEEICTIFPELDPHTGAGYSPAARRTLRAFEAQALVERMAS